MYWNERWDEYCHIQNSMLMFTLFTTNTEQSLTDHRILDIQFSYLITCKILFVIYKLIFTFFRVTLYSYTIFHSGNCVRNISLAFMKRECRYCMKYTSSEMFFFLGITTIWNFCRGHRIFRVAADSKTLNHSTSVDSFWCWFPDHHAVD